MPPSSRTSYTKSDDYPPLLQQVKHISRILRYSRGIADREKPRRELDVEPLANYLPFSQRPKPFSLAAIDEEKGWTDIPLSGSYNRVYMKRFLVFLGLLMVLLTAVAFGRGRNYAES